MKCICSILLLLFSVSISYSQKLSFKELVEILESDNALMDSSLQAVKQDTIALKKMLQISESKNNYALQCYLLNALGAYFRNKSNYQTAIASHTKALNLAIINALTEQIIISKNGLGVVYRRIDQVIPAIRFHQEALTQAEGIADPNLTIIRNLAIACNSLGNIYLTMDQYDDAFTMFSRSLKIEDSLKNDIGLAINYHNIGAIYEEKKNFERALYNYKTSLRYNEQAGSAIGKLICNNSIGGIYIKLNDLNSAKEYLSGVINDAENIQDEYYKSLSYMNTGWLMLLNNDDNGIALIENALKTASNKHFLTILIDGNHILYEAYKTKGEANIALYHYQKYSESKENLLNETNLNYVNSLQSKYELEKKKNEYNELRNEYDRTKTKMNNNIILLITLLLILILLLSVTHLLNRQKDLQQEKKLLTLQQDLLSLQMNPHFLFNAFNSIKLFIIRSDKENAVFYLNKFALLFRTILTSLRQKEVSLKEELDNIGNYVELENMRFSNSINFSVQIDESLPLNKIFLPSLLLQVFVENAILHGLSPKIGEKILKINVEKYDDENIKIEIFDNGIGRKIAERKNKNYQTKKSMGISITDSRLKSHYGNNYNFEIKDLEELKDKTSGTLVILILPTDMEKSSTHTKVSFLQKNLSEK